VLQGPASEVEAMRNDTWMLRRRFTASFLVGHAVRAMVETPLLDGIARLYNRPEVRGVVTHFVGSALAGSSGAGAARGESGPSRRASEPAAAEADAP
jgi:menaquinone-9 beta-reductase